MSNVQITRDTAGRYKVAGSLVFTTVRDALKQSAAAFASESEWAIDLSQVSGADSAGLALLIEWHRLATKNNRPLRFIDAPTQLRALAKISDLDDILPFA
ncbi:MAG TPA: STAS domain-containing protein [Steroidobacteraceae bacterium]|nr:STAS domain-containing protein [Steroidobacteraceae bacterium]